MIPPDRHYEGPVEEAGIRSGLTGMKNQHMNMLQPGIWMNC